MFFCFVSVSFCLTWNWAEFRSCTFFSPLHLVFVRKMNGRQNIKINRLQQRWKLKDESSHAVHMRYALNVCVAFCGSCAISDALWSSFLLFTLFVDVHLHFSRTRMTMSSSSNVRDPNYAQNAIYVAFELGFLMTCIGNIMEIDWGLSNYRCKPVFLQPFHSPKKQLYLRPTLLLVY